MKTIFISLVSTVLISNIAWSQPASETTTNTASGSEAIVTQANHSAKAYKPYTNESEKNNSLFRGALAIHEMNVTVFSNRPVDYTPSGLKNSQKSSFSGLVLEKHLSQFK